MADPDQSSQHDIYTKRKAEFKEQEQAARAEALSRERKILSAWALRFDGHKCREETGFDDGAFTKRFFETGNLEWAKPLDCLTMFCLLQRWLFKWGGDQLPLNHPDWRLFRELFLHTAALDVPPRYQGDPETSLPEWYERWDREYRMHRDEHLQFVRAIHEATEYSSAEK